MILAIDTATEFAGLALYNHDGVWAEEIWRAGYNHTVELAPRVNRLLTGAKLSAADLTGLAVCIGPGSYTGLRIGISLAKGLAMPHHLPTVGIPSLDITAHPYHRQPLPVIALARAGRKRIMWAQYWPLEPDDNESDLPILQALNRLAGPKDFWHGIDVTRLGTLAELAPTLTEPVLLTGELSAEEAAFLQDHAPAEIVIPSPAARTRRPGVLAELGAHKLAKQGAETLLPVYLKEP